MLSFMKMNKYPNQRSRIRNDLFPGTCQFCSNRRTSCQSSGSSWKMFAATRISSSDDQFDRSWSIQFDRISSSDDQYNLIGVDQYLGYLTKWSVPSIWHDHWSIWSNDLACNFTVEGVVSTCDLNVFDVMCDTSQCDWDVRNESICDKEQSSIWSWKYLLPVIK